MSFGIIQDIVAQTNIWVQKNATGHSQTTGNLITGRKNGICFTIGNKAYVGLGLNFFTMSYQKDFWEYDPSTNIWTRKADFPFIRQGSVAFSIGNKGYVGIGSGMPGNPENNDFWEYDPSSDTWTKKANFGGGFTGKSFCFSTNTKGYVGTAWGKQFWEYDPFADTWTRKADFAGDIRIWAVGFNINNKGYAGTGLGPFNSLCNDLWEYDPLTDIWTKKADFPGDVRDQAVGFSIGTKGYIGTGATSRTFFDPRKDFWEYDPSTNIWVRKTDFSGTARASACGFGLNGKGYISSGTDINGIDQNDLWEYTPAPPINTSPPIITTVTPNTACAGSTIIITGSNFIGTTSITIGGVPVASFVVNFSTTITAVVGQNLNGAVSVTTPAGTGSYPNFTFVSTNTSIRFNPDTIILINSTNTTLNPVIVGPVNSFQWDPANLLTNPQSLAPQTLELKKTTSFILSIVTPEGCTLSDKVTIILDNELYIPTAFTPNGDGLNDYFRIPPNSQLLLNSLTIYDKWGNIVFYANDITKAWDGKYNNTDCNAGGFVYVLKGVYKKMDLLLKGSFALIR